MAAKGTLFFCNAAAERSHVSSCNQLALKHKNPTVLDRCHLSCLGQPIRIRLATFKGCPQVYSVLYSLEINLLLNLCMVPLLLDAPRVDDLADPPLICICQSSSFCL